MKLSMNVNIAINKKVTLTFKVKSQGHSVTALESQYHHIKSTSIMFTAWHTVKVDNTPDSLILKALDGKVYALILLLKEFL